MQRSVGRAAGGCDHARGIHEGLAGADVARAQVAGDKLHNLLARRDRDFITRSVRSGRHVAVRQGQADGLADASHGVGGELAAARAVTGAGDLFERNQLGQRAVAGGELADRLEHVDHGHVITAMGAGEDRAAIDEDARHVQAQHRHHHAGQALVAAGKADKRVITMASDRHFNRIRNDLAADQRGLHALMAHRDAIGDGDGVEPARGAAACDHALAADIGLRVEGGVARGRVVSGADHADEGPVDLLLGHAHRVVIGAVRRALRADRDVAAGELRLVERVRHKISRRERFTKRPCL